MKHAWMALLATVLSGAITGCSSDDGAMNESDAAQQGDGSPSGSDAGAAAGPDAGATGGGEQTFGKRYEGGEFHLGPVDWEETEWHNACAPAGGYLPAIRRAEGELLAALWNGIPNVAQYCDACIQVTTARGKSALLRVVSYGETTTNSIDVSPAAYTLLNSDEYPRTMSWVFTTCPDTGKVMYEIKSGSSEWWTSLWVRNARLPLSKVEVKSANHGSFITLARETDGALTDASGFGKGQFTVRLTALDGSTYEDTFPWPTGEIAGMLLTGHGNF